MKKCVSLLLALTLVCSLLTGLSAQAADEETALTIYTQTGEFGPKTAVKSYTADELKALAETKEDGYGYQYFKNGAQAVVATEYVTLDVLLADAGVTFAEGNTLHFTCGDGEYTKFAPSYKDINEGKYFFNDETSVEVPAAIAISWGAGALADGTVADIAKTAKESGLRFVCGTTEADYKAEKAAGKRMPSGVMAISVATESVSYTDIAAKAWYRDAVTYCSDNGIVNGIGGGKFAPAAQMNMASLATMLYRVAGNTTDNSGEKWYSKQQAWSAENGIIAAESFDAAANVNRAAFVTMFYKTLALDSKYDTAVTDEMRKAVETATDYAAIDAADLDAIAWAVSVGLIKGTDDSTLTVNPAAEINRAEVCTMLQRYYTGLAK